MKRELSLPNIVSRERAMRVLALLVKQERACIHLRVGTMIVFLQRVENIGMIRHCLHAMRVFLTREEVLIMSSLTAVPEQ